MFIKVDEGVFVNTDHVAVIKLGESTAQLYETFESVSLKRFGALTTPIAAAHYLLGMVEANTALALGFDLAAHAPTLTSKIAQALRDSFPQGATDKQLSEITGADFTAIHEALEPLTQERVVVPGTFGGLWYHASNAPRATASSAACNRCTATIGGITRQEALASFYWQETAAGLLCNSCVRATSNPGL